MKLQLHGDARIEFGVEIVNKLAGAGFVALFAGGCVRDWLMGNTPKDIDIATSARPDEIRKLFPGAKAVGEAFGVVIVRRKKFEFEVATFRSDGEYHDGRHPDGVTLHDSPERDAARRDFSINGMFFDPLAERVLDFVGGRDDLNARVIRAIGEPHARFGEDHLRLLRAVRFAARFGFEIAPDTWAAMGDLAPKLARIAPERLYQELTTILLGPRPDWAFDLMQQAKLTTAVLPEVAALDGVPHPTAHAEGDVFTHVLCMLRRMRADSEFIEAHGERTPDADTNADENAAAERWQFLRRDGEWIGAMRATPTLAWGVLLHDVGKAPTFEWSDRPRYNRHATVGADQAETIARRLKFSNDVREQVMALVADHMRFIDLRRMKASTLKKFLRRPHIEEHLALHRIDCLGSHGSLKNVIYALEKLDEFTAGPPESALRPPPLLTGNDLKSFGYTPGPIFKEILAMLEDAQLDGQINTRDQAIRMLRENFPLAPPK